MKIIENAPYTYSTGTGIFTQLIISTNTNNYVVENFLSSAQRSGSNLSNNGFTNHE
jgi:hypothetical protein